MERNNVETGEMGTLGWGWGVEPRNRVHRPETVPMSGLHGTLTEDMTEN